MQPLPKLEAESVPIWRPAFSRKRKHKAGLQRHLKIQLVIRMTHLR